MCSNDNEESSYGSSESGHAVEVFKKKCEELLRILISLVVLLVHAL